MRIGLSFLPNRCEHDVPTSTTNQRSPEIPVPSVTNILQRPVTLSRQTTAENDEDDDDSPISQTRTRRVREPRPVHIAMIGAAAYRQLSRTKGVKTFSVTPCQIDQMIDSLQGTDTATLYEIDPPTIEETRAKLPLEYHDFLDVFDRKQADLLPPHRAYDHKIELEGRGQMPKSRLYPMSGLVWSCVKRKR